MKTLLLATILALVGQVSLLHAQAPLRHQVLTRATLTPDENAFGSALAVSSSFIVVGERYSDDYAFSGGSVSLLSPSTGGLIRKLRPPTPEDFGRFGFSVAAAANLVVVSQVDEFGGPGIAYVFDGNTGRKLRDLVPVTLGLNDEFGTSVSASGNLAVVGAPSAVERTQVEPL